MSLYYVALTVLDQAGLKLTERVQELTTTTIIIVITIVIITATTTMCAFDMNVCTNAMDTCHSVHMEVRGQSFVEFSLEMWVSRACMARAFKPAESSHWPINFIT